MTHYPIWLVVIHVVVDAAIISACVHTFLRPPMRSKPVRLTLNQAEVHYLHALLTGKEPPDSGDEVCSLLTKLREAGAGDVLAKPYYVDTNAPGKR